MFTCNHCPYAKAYEERLVALDKKYKTKGYPVIAINPNDPVAVPADGFEEMQKRAQEAGFTFPYLLDEGQKIYPLLWSDTHASRLCPSKNGKRQHC